MTEQDWNDLKDRELDEQLGTLFKSIDPPTVQQGFVSRTMKAVRSEALPPSRRALRHPLIAPLGWAALVTAVTGAAAAAVMTQPAIAQVLTAMLTIGLRGSLWLMHSATAGIAWSDVVGAVGRAIALGIATKEGSLGILLVIATAALSLTALLRLLEFERKAQL